MLQNNFWTYFVGVYRNLNFNYFIRTSEKYFGRDSRAYEIRPGHEVNAQN